MTTRSYNRTRLLGRGPYILTREADGTNYVGTTVLSIPPGEETTSITGRVREGTRLMLIGENEGSYVRTSEIQEILPSSTDICIRFVTASGTIYSLQEY